MTSREEHLAWCKARALALLDDGDHEAAVQSMISDLIKIEPPLYQSDTFNVLAEDGMLFRKTPEQVRLWIEGFN